MKKPITGMIGYIVLAFGSGMLVTYFLPCCVLVILEAVIMIAAGALCLCRR